MVWDICVVKNDVPDEPPDTDSDKRASQHARVRYWRSSRVVRVRSSRPDSTPTHYDHLGLLDH
jgi:hypothetical protein